MVRTRCYRLMLALVVATAALFAVASPVAAEEGDSPPEEEPAAGDQLLVPGADLADDDIPTVTFGDLEPGVERASLHLQQNFSHFLDRRELGFDQQLLELVQRDLHVVWETASHIAAEPTAVDPQMALDITLILVVLALFTVLFFAVDRPSVRLAHRFQARLHIDTAGWLTAMYRKLVLVAGRSGAFVVLIGLSYFPIRAAFGTTGWTLLLTRVLWLSLIYRILKTLLVTTLRLHPRNIEARPHFARLEMLGMFVLQVTLVFLVTMAAIELLEYRPQVAAFVSFVFRVFLVVVPLLLLGTREAILKLLPAPAESGPYQPIHAALARNYYAILGVTAVLLAFNAAGYVQAATYLLTRGYGLILIVALWVATIERLDEYVQDHRDNAEERDQRPSSLPRALQLWGLTLGTLLVAIFSLRMLGLYRPLIALLETPIVAIGRLQVSLLNLASVVLIVGGAYLSVRLLKAVLNAKVYPAMGVDIGIAYAINTLINYALVVVAFILCLVALGVQLSAVMVVVASLGVGIGFGLQNIAENLVSGFILLFGRAVQKGDFITVNELYGRVEGVGARSVVVRTPDNHSMLIPSKEIVSGRIINWTFQDSIVRIHIPVGVSYDSDPSEVRRVLLETAGRHPDVLEQPEPDVWIVEFADSSIQFELLVYFDCRDTNERSLKGKFNFLIWEAFQEADIEIPFPQRDLHLRSLGDAEPVEDPDE